MDAAAGRGRRGAAARTGGRRLELAAIPNFGKKSIDEVVETLRARGLELRAA